MAKKKSSALPLIYCVGMLATVVGFILPIFRKAIEVFDKTQDKEEYNKYRNLYRRVSQQILMTLITLDAKGMLPNTIVVTDEIEFPTIDFDPTLFQKDLTIISSVHPENAFGTYYQNCSPANFIPYKVRGDSHVLK